MNAVLGLLRKRLISIIDHEKAGFMSQLRGDLFVVGTCIAWHNQVSIYREGSMPCGDTFLKA